MHMHNACPFTSPPAQAIAGRAIATPSHPAQTLPKPCPNPSSPENGFPRVWGSGLQPCVLYPSRPATHPTLLVPATWLASGAPRARTGAVYVASLYTLSMISCGDSFFFTSAGVGGSVGIRTREGSHREKASGVGGPVGRSIGHAQLTGPAQPSTHSKNALIATACRCTCTMLT